MGRTKNKQASSKGSQIFLFLFGIPFFAMGAFFCWLAAIQPILLVISSGDWPQVPCQIVSSEVERHFDSDGDTYSVAITFSYAYQGVEYEGGSYDFDEVNSSRRKGKAEIVSRYPVGSTSTCWVNPEDPQMAVLSRKVPGIVYFIIPFTSIFMFIGLGCMLVGSGLAPKSWQERMRPSGHKRVNTEASGHIELKAGKGGRVGNLAGMLFFCLFWNGIVGIFVWQAVVGFIDGDPEWFLVFFLIPFVLVGLGTAWGVVYYLLALYNPKPSLKLNEGSPRLGDAVHLSWQFSGNVKRLRTLHITLEGHEEATYRRGTHSTTDKSLFYKESLAELGDFQAIASGQLSFTVPRELMHSFQTNNNKIAWNLRLQGDIKRWPDVNDAYPITIRPLKGSS